ncbi:hypothetical protein F9802_10070 [Bacillus aerolatus]|uniref:Helix-turn-helix domain-containing protein n=1 Tax=Bacillus aerolatus TaxID=2653354 RepID=A0A6I1FEV8_9BACI|nr:hypothetical protein [Bacillus aerolatus]KAB7706537.1 hypothetical protein F9802_10070 [Bacillus aerolatus]
MEAFLFEHKADFTKGEIICLKVLLRFCAKVAGVSNASISTLLKAAAGKWGPVSESTFHRMKRKAVKFGLLSVHATERKDQSQSSNLWVFNRWMDREKERNDIPQTVDEQAQTVWRKEKVVERLTPHKTSNLLKTNQPLKTRSDQSILAHVPEKFAAYAKGLWSDPFIIKESFRIVLLSTKYYFHYTADDREEIGLEALRILFKKIKSGKRINRVFGYYWGIVNRLLDEQHFEWLEGVGSECAGYHQNTVENDKEIVSKAS